MLKSYHAPFVYIKEILYYNQYICCLFNLYEENEFYKDFIDSPDQRNGKHLYLNHGYHLKGEFDVDRYIEVIKQIKPQVVVLPDVLDDAEETIKRSNDCIEKLKKINYYDRIMGVMQGKTEEELLECVNAIDCDIIGVPHNSKIFLDLEGTQQILEKKFEEQWFAINRYEFIKDKLIKHTNKPLHLLGANSFIDYTMNMQISQVESIDSSLPVFLGIEGKRYKESRIAYEKSKRSIDFYFYNEYNEMHFAKIQNNLKYIKKMLKFYQKNPENNEK